MGYDKYDQTTKKDNYRNGSSEKTIKTLQGHINILRDRNASFDSVIIEKYNRDISDIDNKIINLYARGMSTRDISESINDIYGVDVILIKSCLQVQSGKTGHLKLCILQFLLTAFTLI